MIKRRMKYIYNWSERISSSREVEVIIEAEDESDFEDTQERIQEYLSEGRSDSAYNRLEGVELLNSYEADNDSDDYDSNNEIETLEEYEEEVIAKRNHLPKWMQQTKEESESL